MLAIYLSIYITLIDLLKIQDIVEKRLLQLKSDSKNEPNSDTFKSFHNENLYFLENKLTNEERNESFHDDYYVSNFTEHEKEVKLKILN